MRHLIKHGFLFLLLAVMALPLQAAAEDENSREVQAGLLTHVSQQVALRFAAAHPSAVEGPLREAGERLREVRAEARAQVARSATPSGTSSGSYGRQLGDRFNLDDVGLPQNEESVAVCRSRPRYVLSGANDTAICLIQSSIPPGTTSRRTAAEASRRKGSCRRSRAGANRRICPRAAIPSSRRMPPATSTSSTSTIRPTIRSRTATASGSTRPRWRISNSVRQARTPIS